MPEQNPCFLNYYGKSCARWKPKGSGGTAAGASQCLCVSRSSHPVSPHAGPLHEPPDCEKTPSPALSSLRLRRTGASARQGGGGEGDALPLLGACYKQATPKGVSACCGSGVQGAKIHFREISPRRDRSGARGRRDREEKRQGTGAV